MKLKLKLKKEEGLSCGIFMPIYLLEEFRVKMLIVFQNTRLQMSSDSITGFNSAKYDRTYSGSLGLTATRSLGEASSFMINTSFTDSDQEEETSDDFETYGLTFALDTSLGNQSLSPYLNAKQN